ncbi:LOW QUALITY PROTEIN: hypothetical protein YC2023_065851 [Brassica napus]
MRSRGRPRKSGLTGEGLGPIRMEDSVPTRKHGRPRKIPSIDADRLRTVTKVWDTDACQVRTALSLGVHRGIPGDNQKMQANDSRGLVPVV